MDGRYAAIAAPLRDYFSEAALIRERIRVEALWFEQLTLRGCSCWPARCRRRCSSAAPRWRAIRELAPPSAVKTSSSASITTSRR